MASTSTETGTSGSDTTSAACLLLIAHNICELAACMFEMGLEMPQFGVASLIWPHSDASRILIPTASVWRNWQPDTS